MSLRRRLTAGLCGVIFASFFIAGCASRTGAISQFPDNTTLRTGRLAVHLEDDPSKDLNAQFELSGQRQGGQLWLSGALGTTLAHAQWSPENARLQAQGQTRDYPDLDALLQATLGLDVPVDAFFDWLEGREHLAQGWRVDLSGQPGGRLHAWRELPPRARLSLVWTITTP